MVVWILYLHTLGKPAAVDIPSVWAIKTTEAGCKKELPKLNKDLTRYEFYCQKATVTD